MQRRKPLPQDWSNWGVPGYPVREEPASNFDLAGATVDEGQYFCENSLPERIAGEPFPPLPESDETQPESVTRPQSKKTSVITSRQSGASGPTIRSKVRTAPIIKPPPSKKSGRKPEPGTPDWKLEPWERDIRHHLQRHPQNAVAEAMIRLDPVNDRRIGEMPSMTILLCLFNYYYGENEFFALLATADRIAALEDENAVLKAKLAELEQDRSDAKDPAPDPTEEPVLKRCATETLTRSL
jgi:hypothetical protein